LRIAAWMVKPQFRLPVWYRAEPIGDFRADLLIAGVVMVERIALLNG
jgi:PD-(D/E)XK nuclease superfamily